MRTKGLVAALGIFAIILAGCRLAETPTSRAEEPAFSPSPTAGALPSDKSGDSAKADPTLDPAPTTPQDITQRDPTATAAPSPTPGPVLRQLTSGGCCVEPFWSLDGDTVLYIDRPSVGAPSGIWGINLGGGEPMLVTDRLGIYAPDMALRATLVNGTTVVERLATGEQWRIPNDGRTVSFSADGEQLAWTAGQSGPPFDTARREVWVSRFDGSQARQVFSITGGGFAGWFPDGRLLMSGRIDGEAGEQAYWALSTDQGEGQPELVELGRGGRIREAKISKDGSWLAYMVTFSQDPSQDGLWLADTRSGERRRLELFGGYQWRDADRLLVIPLDTSQPFHRLLQVQAASGEIEALTDPVLTQFKIANGDWSASPDGANIAFQSAMDGNIWVLEIP